MFSCANGKLLLELSCLSSEASPSIASDSLGVLLKHAKMELVGFRVRASGVEVDHPLIADIHLHICLKAYRDLGPCACLLQNLDGPNCKLKERPVVACGSVQASAKRGSLVEDTW